ncbi:hypothetical protein [Aeromonas salmonicida]|uniref:hypothetical protein n=1 Tax=Aeromonas salmonicida TaxID=645 RepID=UPI003D222C1D
MLAMVNYYLVLCWFVHRVKPFSRTWVGKVCDAALCDKEDAGVVLFALDHPHSPADFVEWPALLEDVGHSVI